MEATPGRRFVNSGSFFRQELQNGCRLCRERTLPQSGTIQTRLGGVAQVQITKPDRSVMPHAALCRR